MPVVPDPFPLSRSAHEFVFCCLFHSELSSRRPLTVGCHHADYNGGGGGGALDQHCRQQAYHHPTHRVTDQLTVLEHTTSRLTFKEQTRFSIAYFLDLKIFKLI